MNQTISEWATHFYIGNVEDHNKVLETFLPYINDESFFVEPWIYAKCRSTCQSPKNADLPWDVLFNAIKPNVEEYLASLNPTTQYTVQCSEVWMNCYDEHGFQEIHDHAFPERSFACSYILELDDSKEAGLIFENTNFPIVQSSGINRIFDAFNHEKFIPHLKQGSIVIFPSWIKHYVLPNESKIRRTSISANFSVKGDY